MTQTAFNEMLVHVPVCTHKEPKKVLVLGEQSSAVVAEVKKHSDVEVDAIESKEFNFLQDAADANYDIVLITLKTVEKPFFAHVNRVLKEDGLVVSVAEDIEDKALYAVLGETFKIVMPYALGSANLILASKFYHPTADVILQRSDLIDGNEYYNTEMHAAAFALPNYVRTNLRGYIKN